MSMIDMTGTDLPGDAQPGRNLGLKVLLVATSHTGNNVFCTPSIRLLKKHNSGTTIDIVALNQLSAEVFADNPDINRVHVTSRAGAVRSLSRNYSHVICLNAKSNYLLEGVSVPHIEAPGLVGGSHHAEQLLQFLASYLGCEVVAEDRQYRLYSARTQSSVIDKYRSGDDDTFIGIHLGIGRTSIHGWKFFYRKRSVHRKLWPLERYIELGLNLQSRDSANRIVLTGTSNERFLAKKFAREVPGTINLVGKTSVSDLVRLMTEINLFISQDSGVLHIASASDVPLIGLFGPTSPTDTGPYPPKARSLVINDDSMELISAPKVADVAMNLLRT